MAEKDLILEVKDLKTHFFTDDGQVPAVDGVTFTIRRGAFMAMVGESGCGKSVTSYSILRLIQKPGRIIGGSIMLNPKDEPSIDIAQLNEKSEKLYHVRGGLVSMIFQEPMTALSPVHTIGNQIAEAILMHQDVTKHEADQIAIDMLGKVGIPGPEQRLTQYPHELSGGMRQRVVIAMALVCKPELLIADEPTTALDVTIQAQILELIKDLQAELGISVLLITHDLGVVAQVAEEVAVMYLGRIAEQAAIRSVLKDPRHPYTKSLLRSLPSMSDTHTRLESIRGSVPSLLELPSGCPFHPRCDYMDKDRCKAGGPPLLEKQDNGALVACLRAKELQANGS